MSRVRFSLAVILFAFPCLSSAQESRPSTPTLRADRNFTCSVEPRLTPIPDLWAIYSGELRAELIIQANGAVAEVKAVKSTYAAAETESAMKNSQELAV